MQAKWRWFFLPLTGALLLASTGAALAASPVRHAGQTVAVARAPFSSTFWNEVAAKLGVSAQSLEAAVQSVMAAQRGSWTKPPAGTRPGHFPGGAPLAGLGQGRPLLLAAAANYLGVSTTTLASDLRSGETLAQIATNENRSVSGLEAALESAATARIDQAVQSLVNRSWQGPATPQPGTGTAQ